MSRFRFHSILAAVTVFILLHVKVEYRTLNRIYVNTGTTSLRNPKGAGKPLQILEKYMAQHSIESLQQRPENRTYAIAYYSCPHRAGNFLHSFFNTVIWAIAHNRTILWKYEPVGTLNPPDYCNNTLRIRKWIPSYDEWSRKLNLPEAVAVKMNTRKRSDKFYTRQEQLESLKPQVIVFPQIPDIHPQHPLGISPVSWWEDPVRLTQPVFRNIFYYRRTIHLPDRTVRQTLTALYENGIYFMYGMILKHFFEFDSSLMDPVVDSDDSDDVTSLALHSRHASVNDNGTNIQPEIKCLRKLLPRPGAQRCVVFLMSDREATLMRLKAWLQDDRHCRAVIHPHETNSTVQSKAEHGPFAGMLFLADLATASQARTGVIGDFSRSSSALLLEMITYEQGLKNRPPVQVCDLPDRNERPQWFWSFAAMAINMNDCFAGHPKWVVLNLPGIVKQRAVCAYIDTQNVRDGIGKRVVLVHNLVVTMVRI